MPDWESCYAFRLLASVLGPMQQPLQPSRSTSRLASVPKKLWRSRAKSQSRLAATASSLWIPEGNCRWKSFVGQRVILQGVPLLHLSEMERLTMQQVALARLKSLSIACDVPKEGPFQEKPKRRPALLRKKAATTSFFERKDGKEKESSSESLVFGIPLSNCIQNDRAARLRLDSSLMTSELDLTNRRSESLNEPLERTFLQNRREGGSSESLPLLSSENSDRASVSSIEERTSLKSLLYGNGPQVPRLVNSCFRHLETHGLNTLGIFRVSSSKKRVRQLRDDFDVGQEPLLGEEHHPHDVAQLLKEYFRDLPEPVLTRDLYHAFLSTLRLRPAQQLEAQKLLVALLPVYNRDTLWALFNFLSRVASYAEDTRMTDGQWVSGNKMDAHNLATLFGPNLLRLSTSSSGKEFLVEKLGRAEERSDVILVVRNLIENNSKIFQVTIEEQDAIYRRLQVEDPEALDAIMRWRFYYQIEATTEAVNAHPKLEATRSVPTISITNEAQGIRPLTFTENAQSRSMPATSGSSKKNDQDLSKNQKKDRIRYSIKVHERKNKIEKSASSSAILHNERDNSSQDYCPVVLSPASNLTSILMSSSASTRRKSKGTNNVSGVRFQNERWKRWEIISSEYTEQGTLN